LSGSKQNIETDCILIDENDSSFGDDASTDVAQEANGLLNRSGSDSLGDDNKSISPPDILSPPVPTLASTDTSGVSAKASNATAMARQATSKKSLVNKRKSRQSLRNDKFFEVCSKFEAIVVRCNPGQIKADGGDQSKFDEGMRQMRKKGIQHLLNKEALIPSA